MKWPKDWGKGQGPPTGSPGPDMETEEEETREALRKIQRDWGYARERMDDSSASAMQQKYLEQLAQIKEMEKLRERAAEAMRKAEVEPTVSMKQAQAIMEILIQMAAEEDAAGRAWMVAKAAGLLLGLAGERDREIRRGMTTPAGTLRGMVDDGQAPGRIYRAQNVGQPSEGGAFPGVKGQW